MENFQVLISSKLSEIYKFFNNRIPPHLKNKITIQEDPVFDFCVIVDCEDQSFISVNFVDILMDPNGIMRSDKFSLQYYDSYQMLAFYRCPDKDIIKGHLINNRKSFKGMKIENVQ